MGGQFAKEQWSSPVARQAADEACMWLGLPRTLDRRKDGIAIWTEFHRAPLFGSLPALFSRIMVMDKPSGCVWIFMPIDQLSAAASQAILNLPNYINYNRETQELVAIGDDMWSAMSAMHNGVVTLAGPAANITTSGSIAADQQTVSRMIRAMYADIYNSSPQTIRDAATKVERFANKARRSEHYETYDDGGIASNNPQYIDELNLEDQQFYAGLQRVDNYPYQLANAAAANNQANQANQPSPATSTVERLTNAQFTDTGIRSNEPYAVAYTDDERNDFYTLLNIAENTNTARPGNVISAAAPPNYRLEANYQAAVMNSAAFPGPYVLTTGNPNQFTLSSAPDMGIIGYAGQDNRYRSSTYGANRGVVGRPQPAAYSSVQNQAQNLAGNSTNVRRPPTSQSGREHLMSNDVRFSPENAAIYYDVGSDVMEISRTYGTVPQGLAYPLYNNVLRGYNTVPLRNPPPRPTDLSTSFRPPGVVERFNNDRFLDSSIAQTANRLSDGNDPFRAKFD